MGFRKEKYTDFENKVEKSALRLKCKKLWRILLVLKSKILAQFQIVVVGKLIYMLENALTMAVK